MVVKIRISLVILILSKFYVDDTPVVLGFEEQETREQLLNKLIPLRRRKYKRGQSRSDVVWMEGNSVELFHSQFRFLENAHVVHLYRVCTPLILISNRSGNANTGKMHTSYICTECVPIESNFKQVWECEHRAVLSSVWC